MEIKQALEIIVKDCTNKFAKDYAKAALEMGGTEEKHKINWEGRDTIKAISFNASEKTGEMMSGDYLKEQLKYVYNNLSDWEGNDEAKASILEHSK